MALDLFSLKDQNVLITGATRGIGAACALALAEAGAALCLIVRPRAADAPDQNAFIIDVIREKCPGTRIEVVYCDLSDIEAVKGVFQKALDVMDGQIHVLVNCAGIQRRAPSLQFSEQDWDDVMNTNLKTVFLLCQSAGRHMVPLKRGRIINFASVLTFQGGLTVPAYAASKGGVAQITKALSNEWSKEGVCVNAIAPGYIETDMNEKLLQDPARLPQISERIPAGRWGRPEDFAGPVVFLASRASQYVCGEVLVVDGEYTLYGKLFQGHQWASRMWVGDENLVSRCKVRKIRTRWHQLDKGEV